MIYCETCQKSEALPDETPVAPDFCEVCGIETLPCFKGGYRMGHPAITENVKILAARFEISERHVFWKFLGSRFGAPLETDRPGVILLNLMVRNPMVAAHIWADIHDEGAKLEDLPLLNLWDTLKNDE